MQPLCWQGIKSGGLNMKKLYRFNKYIIELDHYLNSSIPMTWGKYSLLFFAGITFLLILMMVIKHI
jgi:hypothetical protein